MSTTYSDPLSALVSTPKGGVVSIGAPPVLMAGRTVHRMCLDDPIVWALFLRLAKRIDAEIANAGPYIQSHSSFSEFIKVGLTAYARRMREDEVCLCGAALKDHLTAEEYEHGRDLP